MTLEELADMSCESVLDERVPRVDRERLLRLSLSTACALGQSHGAAEMGARLMKTAEEVLT